MASKPTAVDIFAGAGGLGWGFAEAGFNVVAHVEKDKWACETLRTREIFKYLHQVRNLRLYYDYVRKAARPERLTEYRAPIWKKYPELKEKTEIQVIEAEFGYPRKEHGTMSSSRVIALIERALRLERVSGIDVLTGGPPCQVYSIIGRSRMGEDARTDRRNFLFRFYLDILKHFRPKIFVFENVPGILTANEGQIIKSIEKRFSNAGYRLILGRSSLREEPWLNSRDFGVHQERKRVFLFGVRNNLRITADSFVFKPISPDSDQTTLEAISDLVSLTERNVGDDHLPVSYRQDQRSLSRLQELLRDENIGTINHARRAPLRSYDKEIYRRAILEARKGNQLKYEDLPPSLKRHRNQHSFLDRFKVHWWTDTPHTIVAHLAKDGHYNIHPDLRQLRSLSVREAARIQSFPDNYKFEGPRTAQYVQVGNAVPPLMAKGIARIIQEILHDK